MAYFKNPMFAAEPFEESWHSDDTKHTLASPDDLKAFYKDMENKERQEMLERKLSKRKSHNIWSRKSVKRSTASAQSEHQPSPQPPPRSTTTLAVTSRFDRPKNGDDGAKEMERLEQNEKSDLISVLPSRSIIPDPLRELPAWYTKEDWSAPSSFRMRYPIHNPVGPRYYKNHHLVPPSQYKAAARPPSTFSPSFPPMASNSMQERSDDSTRMPGPSRTPSNSPLPTPSSSQTRVADCGVKPRSRKTSQTAHDTVDLLDVSDPWGTNWHHQSPYDVGLGTGPVAADGENTHVLRSRRSSMTTRETRRRTITPSPLSQSTSAIHLQTSTTEGAYIPRKLTKRRTPLFGGLFSGGSKKTESTSLSLPTSPLGDEASHSPISPADVSQHAATVPSSSLKVPSPARKGRRGSILGRLTRRFSVARRPPNNTGLGDHFNEEDVVAERHPGVVRQSSPEKSKRVAPPPVDDVEGFTMVQSRDADRRSSVSVEAPFSTIGKLMVANPDAPSSDTSTPPPVELPLPAQKAGTSDPQEQRSEVFDLSVPPNPSLLRSPDYFSSPPSHSLVAGVQPPEDEQKFLQKSPAPTSMSPLSSSYNLLVQDTTAAPGGPVGNGGATSASSQRRSIDDKLLPKTSDRIQVPSASTSSTSVSQTHQKRRSSETKRSRSPECGPPPPSSTTKPIPLPNTSVAPPPPSSTTKPVPLPSIPDAPPPPSATTKPVALPNVSATPSAAQAGPVYPFPSHLSAPIAENTVDSSPLSAASILANPPTPRSVSDAPIAASSSEAPPMPKRTSSRDGRRSSRAPSPGISSVTARETETFKLVRSKSGHVYTSSDTVKAAGEQWEVEQVVLQQQGRESKGKEKERSSSFKSKSKERESKEWESRRESRRLEKARAEADVDVDQRNKRSSRSRRQHSVDDIPGTSYSNQPIKRSSSSESPRRQQDETRTGRSQEVTRERRSSRKTVQSISSPVDASKARSVPTPDPTSGVPLARPLERNPSVSVRPTSEVPPSADLNALRAREAWEMERLYKARSMYGMEENGALPPVLGIPSTSGKSDGSSDVTKSKIGSIHGSSHTSFTMQNPLEFYHSMPAAPAPIIYASTSLPNQSITGRPPSQTSYSSPDIFPLTSRPPNPLPEPPREAVYDPSRLSQTLSDTNGRPPEYWTKYAEVTTTAH